jgi:hypothetical protein
LSPLEETLPPLPERPLPERPLAPLPDMMRVDVWCVGER